MSKVKKSKKDKDGKHRVECGHCFFCLNRCPKCDSTDVSVMARIELGWSNDLPDEIHIHCSWGFHDAFIECHSCGADEVSSELGDAIARMCEIPSEITIDDKGVATTHFTEIIATEGWPDEITEQELCVMDEEKCKAAVKEIETLKEMADEWLQVARQKEPWVDLQDLAPQLEFQMNKTYHTLWAFYGKPDDVEWRYDPAKHRRWGVLR